MKPAFIVRPSPVPLAVTLACLFASGDAIAQTDDFNDGNDAGWSHYSPLSVVSSGAAYTFPGGAYRITAPASPAPGVVGPQRAGSLRPEKTYTRVQLAADVTGWDDTINQSLGLIARVGNLGLGTTAGYTYNYNTRSGFHQLTPVLNEAPATQVNESPFKLDPGQRYRMVFTLVGARLLGQTFSVTNDAVPLHSVFGIDDGRTTGTAGVFAFALDLLGPIDATFDNYSAAVPAKVRATVLDADPAIGEQPGQPIDVVMVRLASLETTIDPASIQLEVDGQPAAFDTLEELAYLRIVHNPINSLDPAAPHTATVSFRDEDGTQSFSWPFGAPAAVAPPALLSAGDPGEAFQAATDAVLDAAARTFRVPAQGARRFFRVGDVGARRIISTVFDGNEVVITFE